MNYNKKFFKNRFLIFNLIFLTGILFYKKVFLDVEIAFSKI